MAFTRGIGMLRHKSYDSWIMRGAILFFGHLFLITGFFVLALAISGKRGQNGPIPPEAVLINLAASSIAAYFLFTKWYGLRWLSNRTFRSSQLPGLKVGYQFSPAQVEITNQLTQARHAWSVFTLIAEFRDGFILASGPVAEWLPKHAFSEPFDDVRFVEIAKHLVKNYKFIDRNTYLDRGRPRVDELSDRPGEPSDVA